MANIKDLIQSIESSDSSFDEKLAAINEMEETLVAMRSQEQEAIDDNVSLIVEAIKVMERKVEAQLEAAKATVPEKGDKGEPGKEGRDGQPGRDGQDGRDGKDGQNGQDGADGVSVTDAKIDFDGSLVITLSTGREINVGEVVAPDLAEKIKLVTSGGGTSQQVLDTLVDLQDQINVLTGIDGTLGTMAQQDANAVAITGGTINGTTIGSTTPAAGTFTTLTATGQTSLGGAAGSESLRATVVASSVNYVQVAGAIAGANPNVSAQGADTNIDLLLSSKGTSGAVVLRTNGTTRQAQIAHTASAVNFVQVTGAATGAFPLISAQGSDANIHLGLTSKGNSASFGIRFYTNNGAQEQFRVQHAVSAVNFATVNGSAAGNSLQYYAQGADTNISQVFQSKGTGAINLAPGSSGVNISNGGTVTAITRTANGTGYTSIPSVAISAPTTAGGVQATATPTMLTVGQTIVSGGSGYTVGDLLTLVGGTFITPVILTVSTVSAGAVTGVAVASGGFGNYSVLPSTPASVTGGTGSGATFNLTWGLAPAFTITNAGSGYVEQPTVTFSGGGGSGAAAYAIVGSGTVIKALGVTGAQSLDFQTPSGIAFRIRDGGGSTDSYPMVSPSSALTTFVAQGNSNANLFVGANGSGSVRFTTNGTSLTEQLRVSHTASAVNFVQVTGAATGGRPTISAQGSDTNVGLTFIGKGNARAAAFFNNSASTSWQLSVGVNGVTTAVNFLDASGSAAGSAPILSAQGSDTNIDLALTPKGTGNVRFGTYTGTVLTPTGFIEIRDAGGTIRRLLVG
jgi:hypothetical protein